MKMLITLETPGIFGSNFVFLCILKLSLHWYAKCIILASQALLVKMLITLERHGIIVSNFLIFMYFNSV